MAKLKNAPIMLIIMDGWGNGDSTSKTNAVAVAKTPMLDKIFKENPFTQLLCSGEAVGLPDGQMGNSEVGHTNIGAGRVVYQDLTRITRAIRDGSFFENGVFNQAIDEAVKKGGALHLFGLMSPGGVHSHTDHLYALLKLAKNTGIEKVWVHAFLDGRDVAPKSAAGFLKTLEEKMDEIGAGKIATISGRFYAMDRDKRWDRVQKAYEAIAHADGVKRANADEAINASYADEVTDEFVIPAVIGDYGGMTNNDSIIFYNFRPDRAREMTHAFTDEKFDSFPRDENLRIASKSYATMTQYEAGLDVSIAYPPEDLKKTLGEIIESAGLTQLRIAETEKYAHVTFFFNGGREAPCNGEDRILVPSPKVATYDLKPEMSAYEVTDKVEEAIKSKKYDFIILNYANGDMVGHTGVMGAAVKACETVDECVGRCVRAVEDVGGVVCITADHGNAEQMTDPATGEPFTQHTTNPVPFVIVQNGLSLKNSNCGNMSLNEGKLCDIAPTMLALAGLPIPKEMTGKSLID
ncbi:MAG: 2,3-bisphosphoglycerate-independent phosphoglycerate mutase [Schwartzia sp.]|nr:2,3-bisphosphoglycerate-independent phosphoglycerate mutase [Schwartzia sp. (in: firmicutes)]